VEVELERERSDWTQILVLLSEINPLLFIHGILCPVHT
jgi:hypothetical protein